MNAATPTTLAELNALGMADLLPLARSLGLDARRPQGKALSWQEYLRRQIARALGLR